jgi:IS30 family transposase
MNKKYHRLCAEDRKVIENMNQAGNTQAEIGQAIGFSQSTISKELARNLGQRGYRRKQANDLAMARLRQKRSRPRVIVGVVRVQVEARLRLKHSPDQVSQGLRKIGLFVSYESIYQYIEADWKAGGDLRKELRINGKRRYRRRSKVGRGEKIRDRVDIDERPAVVEKRKRYGDWEADLIQGAPGSGFLLSVYERKSRIGKLFKLPDKSSRETAVGLVMVLRHLKVKTITYDNGLEFAMHGFVNDLLGCESYFCKPYRSWEKGGVENYNGLVRQYFPKGSDFNDISEARLEEVEWEINERPRNVLGYKSPNNHLDRVKAA